MPLFDLVALTNSVCAVFFYGLNMFIWCKINEMQPEVETWIKCAQYINISTF